MNIAGLASRTRLPPSPDLGPLSGFAVDPISLGDREQNDSPRLKFIARYDSFQPETLACSPPIVETYYSESEKASLSRMMGVPGDTKIQKPGASSLGALAGPHGIAIFRLVQPQSPIMLLNHAFHSDKRGGGAISLAFQPNVARSLQLASARGRGVLVWEISGHTLNPLWGRLGVDTGSGTESHIVGVSWQPDTSSSNAPILVAATRSGACLWDLRQHSSSSSCRPSLRFGMSGETASPYVQVSCGETDECAVMDSSGMLRVFDIRMTNRTRSSSGVLASFPSLHHYGVGLTSFRNTTSGKSSWLVWGLDSPGEDAVVKVWSRSDSYLTEVPGRLSGEIGNGTLSATQVEGENMHRAYEVVAECSVANLACARVWPGQADDTFITVSQSGGNGSIASWNAHLWKFNHRGANENLPTAKAECLLSFVGGQDVEMKLQLTQDRNKEVGPLRGAELGLVSMGSDDLSERSADTTLLLCTLTEKGCVASHLIAEALPKKSSIKEDKRQSPKRDKLKVVSLGHAARMFPSEDREFAVSDAARAWKLPDEATETRTDVERLEIQSSEPPLEGSVLPFDMDSPVFSKGTTRLGATAVASIGASGTGGPSTVEDVEQRNVERADAVAMMSKIETDRIPCPRLCGASFASGVGGLVMFQNGDVQKVWTWWEKNRPARFSTVPGMIGESISKEGSSSNQNLTELQGEGHEILLKPSTSKFPRTLQDLNHMKESAREAQWGNQEDSDVSSEGFQGIGGNFFEDDSDASFDSADDHADDLLDGQVVKDSADMYNHYFGETNRPLGAISMNSGDDETGGNAVQKEHESSKENLIGTSSDTLAPEVRVLHGYDKLSLNGQNLEFAKRWKLGDIDNITERAEGDQLGFTPVVATPTFSPLHGLPGLVPPLDLRGQIGAEQTVRKTETVGYPDDEHGVHGGEYSVRPSMHENMVFMRKLFTHQAEGTESMPTVLSPIDGPMLPQGLAKVGLWSGDTLTSVFGKRTPSRPAESVLQQPGVCTMHKPPIDVEVRSELLNTRRICLHNASVCHSLGHKEKSEVWSLLARLVDMRRNDNRGTFDGWGGFGGRTAFSQPIVENLLHYYEYLGDVQMLSTIVCVLRKTVHEQHDEPRFKLLPTGCDEKYDMYIRRYADLLYGWRLLTIRSEVMKHLVRPSLESEAVMGSFNGAQMPGISLTFSCTKCDGETDPGTNRCRSCNDYAFRCIICENAVRGLFTSCRRCGHGGHTEHVKAWFSSADVCPSGCGCKCLLYSQTQRNDIPLAPVNTVM